MVLVCYSVQLFISKLLTGELPKAGKFGEKDKEKFPSLLEQICIFGEQLTSIMNITNQF